MNNDRQESIWRLREIQDEIEELAREAYSIVSRENHFEGERARSYWLPHIVGAVRKETEWLGGSMVTIDSSIQSLEDEIQIEECVLCGKPELYDEIDGEPVCQNCYQKQIAEDATIMHELDELKEDDASREGWNN